MFGMGMGEIVLIAVVALLVLGPERLPGAAKAIGKGIRDLRQQTKSLQSTIEADTEIGDAVREIRGALRGDPETLYKNVTGDDWQGSDYSANNSDSSVWKETPEGYGGKTEDGGEGDLSDSKSLAEDDSGKTEPTPVNTVSKLIDEEFANTDDGWGKEPENSHKAEPSTEPDSDMPVLKAAANTMARGEALDDGDDGEHA